MSLDIDGDREEAIYRVERDAAEAARAQFCADFVAEVTQWADQIGWHAILSELPHAYVGNPDEYGPGRFVWHVLQFVESEGWPGALSAIATAMREASPASLREKSA